MTKKSYHSIKGWLQRLPIAAMFLSGTAALIYETLFFRLTGLTLGNSTVAMALVLAAFMGGLALGSALAGRYGAQMKNPLATYCQLEVLTAVAGVGIIILLPFLQGWLSPLFAMLTSNQATVQFVRAIVALLTMGIPATLMGATLPVMVEACHGEGERFSGTLGTLYAWNTLGAFSGVILAEVLLVPRLGITGTGLAAAILNFSALALVCGLARKSIRAKTSCTKAVASRHHRIFWEIIAAGFLTGFVFLALEVIWFRLLLLFVFDSSLNFAIILSVVLASIGLGSLLVAISSRHGLRIESLAAPLLFLTGFSVILGYRLYPTIVKYAASLPNTTFLISVALVLMLMASLSSGAVFPLLGAWLHQVKPGAARTVGQLSAANTAGGVLGVLTTEYILLPYLNMENSLLLMAMLCAVAACLVTFSMWPQIQRKVKVTLVCTFIMFASIILTYPAGIFLKLCNLSIENFVRGSGEHRVALVETPLQTVQYLRKDLLGEQLYARLITNNYSMSTTKHWAKRYMTLFAALPLALLPEAEDALLVCYGCGNTAKTLTLSDSLRHIDFVDISKEIFDLGGIVFPDPKENPTNDPRVTLYVEDARFFLSTHRKSYDLITGEPPPPKANRVVNLYTREYFELVAERLNEGGMVTYWLPVHQLNVADTRSIVRGFSEVFSDASLWYGDSGNWIMVGVKGHGRIPSIEDIAGLWKSSRMKTWLNSVGINSPAELGSLYLIGGERLRRWATGLPLTDNYPGRLSLPGPISNVDREEFASLMSPQASWNDFARGEGITKYWPVSKKHEVLPWFKLRPWIDRDMFLNAPFIASFLQTQYPDEYLLWAFGSDSKAQDIIDQAEQRGWTMDAANGETLLHLAARATLRHDTLGAAKFIERAMQDPYFMKDDWMLQHLYAVRALLYNAEFRK